MTRRILAFLMFAAPLGALHPAAAQQLRPTDERVATAGGYFTYFLPGERTSQVSVLGTVPAPGLYIVSVGTNLGEVLALAGGPLAGTRSTEVERTTTIRLFRATAGGTREAIYDRTFEAFARDAEGYPVVLDGDVIEVTTVDRRLNTFRDTVTLIATVVGAVSGVILLGLQASNSGN